ncbi:MAG TPA: gliding motility-associated C-terminal domain-containing protein [Bacteroidales bacterium]|jgi:gliding motility-associated-like protein|nr:gliding motility-associated C-terminal domain-containing protein [Bacteroidales bacterium]HPS70868.1 gliding motility-associated C-terminal domain-containing protein [Bacteroidales bacterium]
MKEIGQFFKDRLDQVTPDVPDQLWNNIQKSPDLQKFNRLSRLKRGLLYYATPFLAVTVIALIVWQVATQKATDTTPILVSNVTLEEVSKQPVPISSENTEMKTVNSSISEKKTNVKTETVNNSKTNELIKTQNTTSDNSSTTSNPNIAVSQPDQIAFNNKQTPSHSPTNKTQTPQTIDSNPKNVSNHVIDQNEPDKASNSTTNPDDGKQLYIPKGFTPNSDGINDQFFVIADWEVDNFEILIFNRGGGLVFKSSDIHQGWDGTDNNVEVSQGVYVYKIIYKDQNGDNKIAKGTLTLIR